MGLKISCPHCGHPHRLSDPFPTPGSEVQCRGCGRTLAITYPVGLMDKLRSRGARFVGDPELATPVSAEPLAPTPLSPPSRLSQHKTEGLAPTPVPRSSHTMVPDDMAAEDEPVPPTMIGTDPRTSTPPIPQRAAPTPIAPSPRADSRATPAASKATPPRASVRGAGKPTKPKKKRSKLGCLAALMLLGVIGAGVGAAAAWVYFSEDLPTLETLANYRPSTVTVVYDRDGELLGEIYEQRRYVVEIDRIPEHVRHAFVSAEDAAFYTHKGVDPIGIVRAAFRNVQEQRMAQGASTITQQVARVFLLTSEKKLSRKIREAILATRIEEAFDKDHILYLYLNEIYLGSGAYGVESAARIYFDKHIEDITVAEAAILAGLPQRPSDYSPHKNWDKAKARQSYVLGQMLDKGFIDQATHDAAKAEDIKVVKTENPIRLLAPYYTEHVRRHLVDTYGHERVYNEGLIAHTTCDLPLQQHAQQAVTQGVTKMDNSIGWRGPVEELGDSDSAIAERRATQEAAMRDNDQFLADNARRQPLPDKSTLREGERYEAVVLSVEKKHAVVGVGAHEALIPHSWTKWGYEPNPERSWRSRVTGGMTDTLKKGDVVLVEIANVDATEAENLQGYEPATGKAAARLYQNPALQGGLFSYDLETGAVIAMVGGINIEESEFNRATQAKRQVGSTFKPIVYSAAIELKKFTAGSMVLDAPLTYYDHTQEQLWKPGNYGGDFKGNISLRKALALSRNVVTVRVLDVIGLDAVYDQARKLGITSHLEKDLSMGLGSSSLTMVEMARAYSPFATYGDLIEPYFFERIEDRDGNVLEQHTPVEPKQVMDPTAAGITNWLLVEVATSGTAAKSRGLGTHVAGKTGTTNDFKDAWFVGYSPGVMTAVWTGYDQPASMGTSSTGGRVSLPIWMEFMEQAWPKDQDRDWPKIPNAQWAGIDETTGMAMDGQRSLPFIPGTIPARSTAAAGQTSVEDFLTGGF